MTQWTRVTLSGAVGVIAFDTIASLASRMTGVAYGWAIIGSLALYAGIGFSAARSVKSTTIRMAALAGLLLGLTDATCGWAASWVIGPGRVEGLTVTRWLSTAVFVASMSAGIAAVGGVAGRPTRSPDQQAV